MMASETCSVLYPRDRAAAMASRSSCLGVEGPGVLVERLPGEVVDAESSPGEIRGKMLQ